MHAPTVKRLLVTGRHGFVGTTLARMVGTDAALDGWSLIDVSASFDLLDVAATQTLVSRERPDAVLHLAAQSNVPASHRDPAQTIKVNLFGTLNLLQALKASSFEGPMVYAGSGDVYGAVPENALPIDETRRAEPRNPYAVSKLAAEALCRQWAVTEGFRIVLARPFNHIGPGQSEQFAIAGFARQLAEIGRDAAPRIAVGDIDVTRDFTDVRDVVRAYFALLDRGVSGEVYNICSGRERSLRSLLDTLIRLTGVEVAVDVDRARLRPAEQRRVCGDPSRIRAATQWQATTPIEASLEAMLAFCQRREGVRS